MQWMLVAVIDLRWSISSRLQSTAGYIFDGEIEAFKRDLEYLTMEITE